MNRTKQIFIGVLFALTGAVAHGMGGEVEIPRAIRKTILEARLVSAQRSVADARADFEAAKRELVDVGRRANDGIDPLSDPVYRATREKVDLSRFFYIGWVHSAAEIRQRLAALDGYN